MKKQKWITGLALLLAFVMLATSCSHGNLSNDSSGGSEPEDSSASAAVASTEETDDLSSGADISSGEQITSVGTGSTNNGIDNTTSETSSSGGSSSDAVFTAVTYPESAVKTVQDMGYTEATYKARATGGGTYEENGGYSDSSIVVSPYYTLAINGESVPVYATPVYVGTTQSGALHSYAIIDVSNAEFSLDVQLTSSSLSFYNAIVLPASLNITPSLKGDYSHSVSATINEKGTFTFLVSDATNDASQQYAFTLVVREYVDEDTEIQQYVSEYGADNVIVYDSGVHYIDYINVASSNTVIYLRRGALLVANHLYDIDSDSENTSKTETGAGSNNAIGLTRYPFINIYQKSNVKIVGSGTIDCGALDWHERRGIVSTLCDNIEISGITLVNFPEWTIITYRCSNVDIHDVMIFGYKTNSDGFAICNSTDVNVSDCFARSGDDLFEAKGLGGAETAICENVTFTNCIAWAGKARCFGITGETQRSVSDVTFRHCAVIYRDATWDNSRLGSLAIIVESGDAPLSSIVFDDIEIYHDAGRAINVAILNTSNPKTVISNVVFKNITYTAKLDSQLKSSSSDATSIGVSFSNIVANGSQLTGSNFGDLFSTGGSNCRYSVE